MNDASAAHRASLDPLCVDGVFGVRTEVEPIEPGPSLPGDHPAWQRDVLSLSSRARVIIGALRPLVVKVLTFWDHRLRDITLGSRSFGIDASGCYRLR